MLQFRLDLSAILDREVRDTQTAVDQTVGIDGTGGASFDASPARSASIFAERQIQRQVQVRQDHGEKVV
jgi:hypothetical protein